MTDQCDFVTWAPRELNTIVDHVVNATMDAGHSWKVEYLQDLRADFADKSNLKHFVDGGRRSASQGALGLALYAARPDKHGFSYVLLSRKGDLQETVASAFLAEALALDWLNQPVHR